ncbi:MAG: plasmid pRiA4b ORF-3 family protein [Lachnospiraceae bacterium]|nr:plasmid pRiA4b ORF-3 family protein [Lachnospiraceae bacterium]
MKEFQKESCSKERQLILQWIERKGEEPTMKAFQLKIAIKNSKPPIWRRFVVPSGITFSQLSMILNEVMGWSGYHLFEFEFCHQNLKIFEDLEDAWFGGMYECLEANGTLIDEYLKEDGWFTYTYDLGDQWDHRVTVETVIDDWEWNYPQVMKYKGECPIEDCGGIWGYYECLETIADKDNPESRERLEWMESQGYPNTYDMNGMNQRLKQMYFYTWGRMDTRCQNELVDEVWDGKGLTAVRMKKRGTSGARNRK